jgi:hypothetical protein
LSWTALLPQRVQDVTDDFLGMDDVTPATDSPVRAHCENELNAHTARSATG